MKALRSGYQVQPLTMACNSRGQLWTVGGFNTSFKKARAKSGFAKRLHDLHGTACTFYIRAGLEDEDVSEIMGRDKEMVKQMKRVYVTGQAILAGMVERIERTQKECKL